LKRRPITSAAAAIRITHPSGTPEGLAGGGLGEGLGVSLGIGDA
jgi:hypothetical protein